jgi:phosphoglycolate phosphatase
LSAGFAAPLGRSDSIQLPRRCWRASNAAQFALSRHSGEPVLRVSSSACMATRAVLFDFDGTIADTFEAALHVLNDLADEFGYRRAAPEEIEALRALPAREVAARLGVAWHKLPLIAARARQEMARSMSSIQPCLGIPDALRALRERGLRLGLITSNNRQNVETFLAAQPDLSLDFISAGSGLFSKHRRLKRVLQKQRIPIAEAWYVGDEVRDIEAARTLGLRMIAVGWGYCAPSLLMAAGPDHVINKPSELLDLV